MSESAPATPPPLPIGFKEWTFVCEALGQGKQSLILRKGGIHEGKKGFRFEHSRFWLFPTGFHNQGAQLKWVPANADEVAVPQDEERERVDIRYFAELQDVWKLTDWDTVAALEPYHQWTEEVVRERFVWDEDSCLHAALVRVYRLPQTWSFPYAPSYGGCRSWVKLPAEGLALEERLESVVADADWENAAAHIRGILQSGAAAR